MKVAQINTADYNLFKKNLFKKNETVNECPNCKKPVTPMRPLLQDTVQFSK